MDEKTKKYLDDIFYDKGFLMKNFNLFLKKVRSEEFKEHRNHKIPHNVIEEYYNNQEVVQAFKPIPKQTKLYRPIISLFPFARIYCDSMYLTQPKSTLGFINIVDLFSKYAFSKSFILPKRTSAISSRKATEAFNEFLEEIKKYNIPVGIIYTDRGSEYLGEFNENIEKKKIIQVYANAGDKRKTAPIERFNKTLRLMIEKFKVVYGSINSNILKTIMASYNNIEHANLKYSPIEILESKKIQDEITLKNQSIKESINDELPLKGYCRILQQVGVFKKVSPIWSKEIYKIKSFSNGSYTLEGLPNKYFKGDELLPVEKDKILKPVVEKVEPSITEGVKVIEDSTPVKREKSIRVKKKRDILDI